MSGSLTPIPRWQLLQDGEPVPGALLYTYLSGTSTPHFVYADAALGSAHTNPVQADADGVFPVIFLDNVAYRFFVTDAVGNTIYPNQDNVSDVWSVFAATPQTANTVFAGPVSGAAAAPTFRALVIADIPAGAGYDTVLSNAAVGAQNNWAPGLVGHTLIVWTGASALAVTGLDAGVAGQRVTFKNLAAAGIVATFAHDSASSDADNQLQNMVTSAPTPVAPGGSITYEHTGTDWKLIHHEQGAWITPAFVAGNYTASAGNWTVDAGDVLSAAYKIDGNRLAFQVTIAGTDVSSTPTNLFRLLFGFTSVTGARWDGFMYFVDNGGTAAAGNFTIASNSTLLSFQKFSGTWATTSSDNTNIIAQGMVGIA